VIDPGSLDSIEGRLEPASGPPAHAAAFAHASEAEMARILDFYGVQWHYEPTTFPILWNLEGEIVESFSPDFFLPEFDLYLEMTTLKQSLVRKKNRKLRRLRELYPDIRIKLFYARDFRAMMLKYGRFGLAQALTGTPGQLVGGELPPDVASSIARSGLGAATASSPATRVAADGTADGAAVVSDAIHEAADRPVVMPDIASTPRSRAARSSTRAAARERAATRAGRRSKSG
jgi:hypothetical protein